jgi:phage terminase large subunit-like protein
VAPTFDEVRLVMIEGDSGLLAVRPPEERPKFEPSKRLVTWANASQAQVFSAGNAAWFARAAISCGLVR